MVRESEGDVERRRIREARAMATERDRQVRIRSVANDTFLNLPASPAMPDGEEFPRTSPMQLRSYDQRSEIVNGSIQVPPNRTISNSSFWDSGDGGGSETCKMCKNQPDSKCSSGQPSNSWSSLWKSSGKSPPSHSRTKCMHHQRPSYSPNSKNSSSSSKHKSSGNSSSSSSSSTSSKGSASGLLGGSSKPTLSEKLHTFFSDKSHAPQVPDSGKGNQSSSNSSGLFSRFVTDKPSRGNSKSKTSEPVVQQPPLCVNVPKQTRSVTKTNPNGAGTPSFVMTSKSVSTSRTVLDSSLVMERSPDRPISAPLSSYYCSKSTASHQSETTMGALPNSENPALYSNPSSLASKSPPCQSRSPLRRDCPAPTTMVTTSDNNGNARVPPSSSLQPLPGAPSNTNATSSCRTEEYSSLVDRDMLVTDAMVRNERCLRHEASISHRMRTENSDSQMSLEAEFPESPRSASTTMLHDGPEYQLSATDSSGASRDEEDSNPP